MTHDPMCPQRECDACAWEGEGCCRGDCQCNLIARVRADHTQRILGDISAGRNQGAHDDDWILNGIRHRVRQQTLELVLDKINEVPTSRGRGTGQIHLRHVNDFKRAVLSVVLKLKDGTIYDS